MRKYLTLIAIMWLASCAQDSYRLKIDNNMGTEHGKSIYFRSNLRSLYAGQIRGALSKKFAQSGMKTSASAEAADFIAIFDIETFYKQEGNNTNKTYFKNPTDNLPLFAATESESAMMYSGNTDMVVDKDKTCFTLKIGRRDSSFIMYSSSFCADGIKETEEMVAAVISIYGKYGNYQSADVGVQCFGGIGEPINCDTVHDRQQAFINSFWIDKEISEY